MRQAHSRPRHIAAMLVIAALGVCVSVDVRAQDRFLGKEDILIYGFGLRVEPDHQVVPRDLATIVSTFLSAPTPPGQLLPFSPDAIVKGTLRGPGVASTGQELTASPNSPFNIPPLTVAGTYTLEDIRLESGGQTLMRGTPESVSIDVIEKLLVTQVTARPLSAQEIRDKGIVFDKSNFQAYNFTAAFAVQDTPVQISFPVVLPTLHGTTDATLSAADLSGIQLPSLPDLKTIVPDTLRIQTQIPNLKVIGFALGVANLEGKSLVVPPIPGVVVIPGDIGFLNQFFSVVLMVGNVAPQGSNLVVSDLTGEMLLPAGNDTVVGSDDDPLRTARTAAGESPRIQAIRQPGGDGKLGTADDISTLGPGETGSAEYLVEGRREGTFNVEFAITGTLHGLPGGPVQVRGRAAGSVLVRNPKFTLTFTHPETVTAGERYSLDVTVTNTSEAPANFVSLNLFAQNVSGASVAGDATRQVESIPPGDSATVSFDLIARVTGKVTAATLDSDENVQGRFSLKSSVGELGVPISPDSLVLPGEASGLPANVRSAMLGLLGKAWAVATAPAAALPKDVTRFSKQIVYDRAVQGAEAGMRIALHEPIPDSVAQLEMDFVGSDYSRLGALHPDPTELQFTRQDFSAFDELRRRSIRGDVFASAIASTIAPGLTANGAGAFHRAFAEKVAYRPTEVSVLVSGASGQTLPVAASLVDAQGRRLGGADSTGKVIKQIPFADVLSFTGGGGLASGQLFVLAAPDSGEYYLQFDRAAGASSDTPFTVSIVTPDASGNLRQFLYDGLTAAASAVAASTAGDPYRILLDLPLGGQPSQDSVAAAVAAIAPPQPHVIGAVQQADKDLSPGGVRLGRVIAVLFNEEVTAATVQDRLTATAITNYTIDNNAVVGAALQPGGRVVFLGLRDPVGPFIARSITISGVADSRGQQMASETVPIEMTVDDDAAVVSGRVLNADGTPIPSANVRLFIFDALVGLFGVSSKTADGSGAYSWDWVPNTRQNRVTAVNTKSDESRAVDFTSQRSGQRLNVNVVFLGRGAYKGVARDENGVPLPDTSVRVTSLTDHSQYGATADAGGQFAVANIPVGNVLVEAVNARTNAIGSLSELIPVAGATVVHDITLFKVASPDIVVKFGTVTGHVLRGDGASPVSDVPVTAYYQSLSQTGVKCPDNPPAAECAVAVTRTDSGGAFLLEHVSAGQIRLATFEQASFQQGEARVTLPADGSVSANVLLAQGLGTVHGTVLTADGAPVAGARVGGGLSLTTSDATGHFTLTDVPVGHRDIVAVSDELASRGTATIDILQAGQIVDAAVVLEATATIAGSVFQADGATPVSHNNVYLFHQSEGGIIVDATVTTDNGGHYSFPRVPLKNDAGTFGYTVSAFRPDFSDGNVRTVVPKFHNQVVKADIVFRGGGGHVRGTVVAADGVTPLEAAVGISGDRVLTAGGLVGVAFQNVANYQIANTDLATGTFAFDNVFVGPITLTAVGQFSPDPIGLAITIPSPGATIQVTLTLQATSRIEGTVLQPDGVTPVGKNVIVRFKSTEFKQVCAGGNTITVGNIHIDPGTCADVPQGVQNETAITDDAGHYEVPLVNAGSFTLTAEDPASGKTGQIRGSVRAGQTGDFSIRLLGVSTLTINVRGSDSTTPIPGARVEVTQIAFPKKAIVSIADTNGTVVLGGGDAFAEGDVVVMATDLRTGFAGRAAGKVTIDGGNVSIAVYLFNAAGTVTGTVFKPDGLTPVPNAEVVISNLAGPLAFAVTDDSGVYRQELIPLGAFRVDVFEAATAQHGFGSGRVDFDRQEVPLNIVEAGRGLVTGTALAANSLAVLPNWQVILRQFAPSGRQLPDLQTTTDVDGTFSFPGVMVGQFTLIVTKLVFDAAVEPHGEKQTDANLTGDGEHVDVPVIVEVIRRQFGRVEGVVVNPDGTPAANVAVDLCPYASCVPYLSGGGHLGASSGADGTFAFDHVVIGRFTIRAKSQVSPNAGTADGQLFFEGDTARATVTLVGISQVSGRVVFADGHAAANIQVSLLGRPSSGCISGPNLACTLFTDASGSFTFIDVPARTFDVVATDPVSGLAGAASGVLNPGDHAVIAIVLQAASSVSGRVLFANGTTAAGVTAELKQTTFGSTVDLFTSTDSTGRFVFAAAPSGSYGLDLQDPIGPGVAHRTFQVGTPVSLGDITLDEAPPAVTSVAPQPSAIGVPRNATVQIVLSEPVTGGSVTQSNVSLTGPAGPVLGTLQLTSSTTIAFAPVSPLSEQTRYTLTVGGLTDLVGKTMASPFTSSFTTVDLTPPTVVELTPAAGGSGIALASVIRVKFSEPIDVPKLAAAPIVLLAGTAIVSGHTDVILGNTTMVFTPTVPLAADTEYRVQVQPVVDLSGNQQAQALSYAFRTLDRTPPQVTALRVAGDGTVIENATAHVVAEVGASQDTSVVDFFINDQPSFAARTAPFTLTFQALPSLGRPGDQIKISALATDTSGNRSVTPAVAFVTIVPDKPPVVAISSPASGSTFRNGDRVTVTVHVTDDLGAKQIAYRAQTGKPQDAATRTIDPIALDRTETFAFNIGSDAVPGSSIVIGASAVDTKGQVATATPVSLTVLDATPPIVTITGTTTGTRVSPGQQTSAIVAAQDLGGIASITFATSGVLTSMTTRAVSPAEPSIATSFPFTVPATAHAGDVLALDATAVDAAGNTAAAARVLLPIADLTPPTVQLRTANGATDIVPGSTATLILQADDETGVASASLTGQGAFAVSQAKQVSPASTSTQITFDVPVPSAAADGSILNISATATDLFGNVSVPATLALTVRSVIGVTLPASILVAAGDSATLAVQLSAPAPAGGLRVDLSSSDRTIADVEAALQFAEGETTRNASVSAFVGGNASITAAIGGAPRASTTVAVRGGVVSGTVLDPQLRPVAGAQVLVTNGAIVHSTTSDASGHYFVEDVDGQGGTTVFSVKASDPVSGFIGATTGQLSTARGFAHVNVVIVSAGSIGGFVVQRDGHTPVGAGVRVDLFNPTNTLASLAFVFTDANGAYEFPVVSLGSYLAEASDVNGNRGRSTAVTISSSGQHVDLGIAFLGRGTVSGTVHDGFGNPVGNLPITLAARSVFENAPIVTGATQSDGSFRFDGVFVGSFTLQTHDVVTNLSASASGSIVQDGQVVNVDLRLATWGGLQGTVFRSDGATPVLNARVTVTFNTQSGVTGFLTTTDALGHYAFTFLPLGTYTLEATESSTKGIARVTGALTVHALTVTQNVTFLPQGSLLVTVLDANGATVAGATVQGVSTTNVAGDGFVGVTGADGVTLIEHVLASQNVSLSARSGNLFGSAVTTLQANEVKSITIHLQPTGSIVGTVFLPDGQTPTAGAQVSCFGCAAAVTTGADGSYRFDNVPLAPAWFVQANDAQGRKRAIGRAALTQNGQIATVNLTFIGFGSVAGRVLNPDNSSAPNLFVTVRSLNPDFGGFQTPQTDAAGFYRADNVVVGAIAVSAGDSSRGLLGEAAGTLAHDGDTLTLDVLLKSSAITLPVTKADGNAFTFDIQRDGSIGTGFNGVFNSFCCGFPGGAMYLDLIAGGTTSRFTGANIGTTEANGREVVVSQNNVAGLNVTRKILVSSNYFARYVELLSNPTPAPITVDVRVESNVLAPGIVATSSGDATLDVADPTSPDRWLTLNTGFDADPFDTVLNVVGNAQVGFAFSGAGAARPTSFATFGTPITTVAGQVDYGWTNVTVPPGQTVAFMHFGVQQYSRAAAQASLDRLVKLPPEALESLSPAEIAAIQNFAVPADATSPIAPLPAFGGTITGRLLEADQTPVPASIQLLVRYRSNVIFFGRAYNAAMNANGIFTFGPNATVPLDAFTLQAIHPTSGVQSAPTAGSFAPGATIAAADVVFTNTAVIRGIVRRTSGAILSGTPVIVTFPGKFGPTTASYTTSTDGSYVAGGIPPGTITLSAALRHPQAVGGIFNLTGSALVTVIAGQTIARDLTVQPTGTLAGVVRSATGAVVVNALVDVLGIDSANTFLKLETRTDSSGTYRVDDVPLGTFNVQAIDPTNGFATKGTATIGQDRTTTLNLTLLGVGTVQLTAAFTNGQPAANANVEILRQPIGRTFTTAGVTDATGRLTIGNVPAGAFVVRVHRAGQYSSFADAAGTLTAVGQTVPLTAVLPPFGNVSVQVTSTSGAPIANVNVLVIVIASGTTEGGVTDANGHLLAQNVPGGPILVRATDPQTFHVRDTSTSIASEGETASATIVLNSVGAVTGHVTKTDGSAAVGVSVAVYGTSDNFTAFVVTDATGSYSINNAAAGPIRVVAQEFSGAHAGSFVGQIARDGDSLVADIVMNSVLLPLSPENLIADANGTRYGVTHGGSIYGGSPFDGFEGLTNLWLGPTADTSNQKYFGGDMMGSVEQNGRQLAIGSFNLSGSGTFNRDFLVPQPLVGLNVTRKMYVNPSGYFVRVLDIFDNPTAQPVTINVEESGALNGTRIVDSSTGDTAFSPADQWVLVDNPSSAATSRGAWVFQGQNAATAPGIATAFTNFNNHLYFDLVWDAVTVPAGGRAILMHFQTQGPDQASATAAAQRLAQLPPEALVGLTLGDRAAIQNFSVPPNDSTLIAPFATVSGRVLAADGTTPVPNAQVLVTGSASPFFKPTITLTTDSGGQYSASTLDAGPFTVQAKEPTTGALSSVLSLSSDGQTPIVQDITFTTLGGLSGSVKFASGAPATSGAVFASGGSPQVNLSTPIALDGTYSFPLLPPGTYSVQAVLGDRSTTVSGVVITAGQMTRSDIVFAAQATVRVTVKDAGGSPIGFAYVYISHSQRPALTLAGTTNNSGVLSIGAVPPGPFTIQVKASNNATLLGVRTGTVTTASDGQIIDLTVQSVLGTVTGHVLAADGMTGLASVYIELYSVAPGAFIGSTYSNGSGAYEFDAVSDPTQQGVRVKAYAPTGGAVAEGTGTFGAGPLVLDLTLPVSAVRGTLTLFDGVTPVYRGSITIAQENAQGDVQTFFGSTDTLGHFTVVGVQPGAFEVQAEITQRGLFGRATGTLVSTQTVPVVDVRLGPAGTVSGTVRDPHGNPVANAEVILTSDSSPVSRTRFAPSLGNGTFTIGLVPTGAFTVQACDFTTSVLCGVAIGVLNANGDQLNVTVTVAGTGTVSGTALQADGLNPLSGAYINITAGTDGPDGAFYSSIRADSSGHYSLVTPAGLVTAVAHDPSAFQTAGTATGTLVNSGTLALDIRQGTAVACNQTLIGGTGFKFDLSCAGQLSRGGAAGGAPGTAYSGAYGLRVDGSSPGSLDAAKAELDGRQLVYGPVSISGVLATRKVFVPSTGGFARFLDTISNPTTAPLTLEVQIESTLAGAVHVLTDPATTGNTYAVTQANGLTSAGEGSGGPPPALAHVFAGPGAVTPISGVAFQSLIGTSYYRWTVTVPAGQSVTLMHFAVQAAPFDTPTANAQAQRLVNLIDPDALAGMTAAEKSQIVNFRIP